MPSIGHLIFKMISFVLLNNGYKKKSWRRFERLSFFLFVGRFIKQRTTLDLLCYGLLKNRCNERRIHFILLCEFGTTGEAPSKIITSALCKYALDLEYLRGQCYDGAGNMAGKYEGVAAVKVPKSKIFPLCCSCIKPLCCIS